MEPGYSGTINASILNFGESTENDVLVQLFANGTLVNATKIDFLASGDLTTLSFIWNPVNEGLYNITFYINPVPEEVILNNALWKCVYVGHPVKAVVLHSAGNIYGEIITNWQVLSSDWYEFGGTMIYIDYKTLNKDDITYEDINATGADVLIISCAYDPSLGWEFTDQEIEAIKRYVFEGHGLIATAGTFYRYVPNNNKLLPLFGINETANWDATWTDLLHIEDPSYTLFKNVPNPLVFPAVGTCVPMDGMWDSNELVDGNYVARGHYKESAIVVRRGLVYISPWLEVIPSYYKHHLQLLYNAIVWSRYQKPEHDLAVSLDSPKYLQPGETVMLNASVSNMGLSNETNVELSLLIDGALVNSTKIQQLSVGESYMLTYNWTPVEEKTCNLTAYAPPVVGEDTVLNNIVTRLVRVRWIKGSVLFEQTHWTDDITMYSVWVSKLVEGGYIVETHTSGSVTYEVLENYDVFIIPQAYMQYSSEELLAIKSFVLNGGGLIVIGDDYPSVYTSLTQFAGITWNWEFYGWSGQTSDITQHPITEGVKSAYFGAPISQLNVEQPAVDIIRGGFRGNVEAMLAVSEVDFGRVIAIADEQTVTDGYIGYADNMQLAVNMVNWLVHRYEHDVAVTVNAPTFVEPGVETSLNVTLRNKGLSVEKQVQLELFIDGSLVDSVLIDELSVGEAYTHIHYWNPVVEGVYNITAYALSVENETFTLNNEATKFVKVTHPLIRPVEGEYANYALYDGSSGNVSGFLNFTYLHYISSYQMNITVWMRSSDFTWSGWMVVNIFTREVEWDSGIGWSGMWYPGWIETNVTVGSQISLLWGNGTVVDNEVINVNGRFIDCWEITLDYYGYEYTFLYDKFTGLWISMNVLSTYGTAYLTLVSTNVPIGSPYDHDLAVTLDAPRKFPLNESAIINATIYNVGLSTEENVTLQLTVNETVVANVTIAEFQPNSFNNISYVWSPSAEGNYFITAHALPVYDENNTANNIVTKQVKVYSAKGFILFDQTHGTDVVEKCYSIWASGLIDRGYVISYHVSGKITPQLLKGYNVLVIPQARVHYYNDELSAIQGFVLNGGSLLVIGDDDTDIGQELTSFASITWSIRGQGGYTSDIMPHPVTRGVNLAYFGDPQAYLYVSSQAVGLIRDSGGHVMLAVSIVGAGKVLVIADEDSIVDWCIGEADNNILANNAVDWLVTRAVHDVALTALSISKERAYIGEAVEINVSVSNEGEAPETFNVTVYCEAGESNAIGVQTIQNLHPNESVILKFTWNTATFQGANYTMRAVADAVPGEVDLYDNEYLGGRILVTVIGDVNGDGEVGLKDLVAMSMAYYSTPADPNWNEYADLAQPKGIITLTDLVTLALYYGRSIP